MNTYAKALLPIALVLPACGSSKSSKDVAEKIGDHSELSGAWQGGCHPSSVFAKALEAAYVQERFDFGNIQNSFKRSLTLFNNQNCDQAWFTYDVSGHYDVITTAAEVDGGKPINLTVDKVTLTPKVGDAVDALNRLAVCDAKDWQINKEKVVTDKDCLGLKVANGEVIQDIYKVDNDKLMTGQVSLLDAGSRPSKLDHEQMYTKK